MHQTSARLFRYKVVCFINIDVEVIIFLRRTYYNDHVRELNLDNYDGNEVEWEKNYNPSKKWRFDGLKKAFKS